MTNTNDASQPASVPAVVVGVDLLERGRLARVYARRGERLLERLFTPREIAEAKGQIARLEGRFAAKEAAAKALGVGIGGAVSWREIEIIRLPGGKPFLTLSGGAAAHAQSLGITAFDISITDTNGLVMAVVVGARMQSSGDSYAI